jgi:hypothetical protein
MSREITMEEILDGKSQEDIDKLEAAEPTVNTPAGIPGEALEFSKIEAGGIIKDKFGNEWQVPADNVEDFDDLHAPDFYANLPKELTDTFALVGVPTAKIKDWMQRQYVPVHQSEIGLTEDMRRFAGSPTDSVHTIGDLTLMKIPKVIHERRQALKAKETKRRLDAIEPTAEMIKKAESSGIMTRVERKISQTTGPQDSIILGDK